MSAVHRFSTPLARDLFAILGEAGLAEADQFKARPLLSREEADRNLRAAMADELRTEGRTLRTKPDPKGEA